jgi:hypothetical protein
MSPRENISMLRKALARAADWASSLTGYPPGRLGTGHGRRIRTILTGALVLTGISAWALALVQPWATHGATIALVTMANGVDAERLRTAPVDLEKQISENATEAPTSLRRSPFGPAHARPAESATASSHEKGGPGAARSVAASAMTARQVLACVKGLRLEVIMTTPAGERWVVINGESYREGDAVDGMEIVEIQGTRVRLQQAGIVCLLPMN